MGQVVSGRSGQGSTAGKINVVLTAKEENTGPV